MFWGCVLKEGEPFKVQHALEDGEYPVLHISNAVRKAGKGDDGKTFVTVSMGKQLKNLNIAVLSDKCEVQALDLYLNISQDITIAVQGKGEVHMSGYFEPNNSLEDGMMMGDMEDDEDIDDEEEESDLSEDSEDKPVAKKVV